MDLFALAGGIARGAAALATEEGVAEPGLVINFFWVIAQTASFLLFLSILWIGFSGPISRTLSDRRSRIEQGLKDAEQARRDRESAEAERLAAITEARREANEIIARAQKVAQETRDADIATTREELDRMRSRATAEIEAEKNRALSDLRAEVADLALAAAGKVVGESMTDARQRRLVEEFIASSAAGGTGS